MKYHALFVIFEKIVKLRNCRLLQIIGGALLVKVCYHLGYVDMPVNASSQMTFGIKFYGSLLKSSYWLI